MATTEKKGKKGKKPLDKSRETEGASSSTTPEPKKNPAKYSFTGDKDAVFPISQVRDIKQQKEKAVIRDARDVPEYDSNMQLFGDMVQKGFQRLYGNKDLSDVTLVLDPKGTKEKIYTHKMVLCAWSEMFRAMLSMGSSWREAKLKELPIELDDARSYANFKLMLKYMYTGETDFIKGHNILDLISLSNYYGILSLKEICVPSQDPDQPQLCFTHAIIIFLNVSRRLLYKPHSNR
eukprot:TRINITY_DN21888_c0_g1_i1.p1 TRINITY_DN21888_c0_g1~~TRINITY_DN21888_c0_g1_i1.p1  ORF type:complete len:235 (-),score=31.78 TRINITY_DN21888_c0_g1_i1:23-727(-)